MKQSKLTTKFAVCLLCSIFLLGSRLDSIAQIKYSTRPNTAAVRALIERVVPGKSALFEIKFIPSENGMDVFELSSKGGKILLAGNNGVSVASALNYYLKHHCNYELTWNGPGASFPAVFPADIPSTRKVTKHKYRYYLNYCTFSYSMAWWDWERWQYEIDWMALNGINMPLAITGQEAIWQKVYRKMGLTDKELASFFTGPAYFGWFWMNNMDSYGGPLPQSWIDAHKTLQKQILKRESELGMMPVLPSFTGHIPKSYLRLEPDVKVDTVRWHGQIGQQVLMLNPNDPRFKKIGKAFLEEQTKEYGTSHYYSSDIFNELIPPSGDPGYLAHTSAAVYEAMDAVDPESIWVMQGWLFVSADGRKFWTKDRMKPFLDAVPNDRMVILELYSENRPRWKDTEAYYGKPWIWNMLHNFGGNIGLYGKAQYIAYEPYRVSGDAERGNMSGIGLTMEAIEQNPAMYHLMLEHVWEDGKIQLDDWTKGWISRRYGKTTENAENAWKVLLKTVYKSNKKDQGAPESMITGRPTFALNSSWTWTDLVYYDNREFCKAWDYMIAAADELGGSNGFQYDLVDITRQAMANYGTALQREFSHAYFAADIESFKKITGRFLDLISDMDRLLGSREEFLFGSWLKSAGKWATNPVEKELYLKNARNLVSIWGDPACYDICDYSCRQWNGLLNSYYKGRWQEFFSKAIESLEKGEKWNQTEFVNYIMEWSTGWVCNTNEQFLSEPQGDPIALAAEMHRKYYPVISRTEIRVQDKL